MSPATSRHRPTVVNAAVELLAERGARGLTHGAVDTRAAVPKGTTSNYFRTRDALLGGVLDHILEWDERMTAEAGALTDDRLDADTLSEALVQLTRHQCETGRTVTLARYAVFLEAAARPELSRRVRDARVHVNDVLEAVLTRAGATSPVLGGQRIAATIDGYLLGTVSHGAIDAPIEQILPPVVATAFD